MTLENLRKDYDAIFIASGRLKENDSYLTGVGIKNEAIEIDIQTYQTNLPGVFAGGDAVRKRKVAVRSAADGKEAAIAITQYLSGENVTGPANAFNTRIGKLAVDEIKKFVSENNDFPQVKTSGQYDGFTDEQAVKESMRCLHCDCRKPVNCKLRKYSLQYEAKPTRYKGQNREFVQQSGHPELIFEPGKCIDCGLCIQITAKAGEKTGLTFTGRGFNVRLAVPFERSIVDAIKQTDTALDCVKACPTGALSFKTSDNDEQKLP